MIMSDHNVNWATATATAGGGLRQPYTSHEQFKCGARVILGGKTITMKVLL